MQKSESNNSKAGCEHREQQQRRDNAIEQSSRNIWRSAGGARSEIEAREFARPADSARTERIRLMIDDASQPRRSGLCKSHANFSPSRLVVQLLTQITSLGFDSNFSSSLSLQMKHFTLTLLALLHCLSFEAISCSDLSPVGGASNSTDDVKAESLISAGKK